ncbi:MAG: hypothetical protein ACLQBD_02150 [Syntrophobacteraceae bacterium]
MNEENKRALARTLMPAACLFFGISTIGMLCGFEPFFSFYYTFAWWSYIIFIDSFLYCRGGKSFLFENPWKFLLLLPLSTTVWLVFEALNFRLSNWHYVNIPSDAVLRWTGYPFAFSTVLPGIFSTAALLEFLGVLKNSRTAPLANPQRLYIPFMIAGILFLVLPLVWPGYFFPLVWGAFLFLLEPVNHKAGAPSLLREWERGSLRKSYLLLLAGAICGFLWELWNFRAGAKWIYTVPHLGFLKIFEMPLLGFLGFPPFALECYAMTAGFFLLISKIRGKYPPGRAFGIYAAMALLILFFDLLVFVGIDRFTIISFQHFNFIGMRP